MDKTTLYTGATFLSLVLLTVLGTNWFEIPELGLKLAFLELLTFIAVLAYLTQYNANRRAATVKAGMQEEALLETNAVYYPNRNAIDGKLYTTRNYVIFRPAEGEIAQINLGRRDILSILKEKPPKSASEYSDFGGILIIRLKEQDYRFLVSDIEKWLDAFAEERFGAQAYSELEMKKAGK